jgi:predicted nucleic acid-binding protein
MEADVAAQQTIRAQGRRVTSALTLVEAHRALRRARVTGRVTAEQERRAIRGLRTFARRCSLVAVSNEVLLRAGRPFPIEPIRTLDAIHLATVELLGEAPQLVTIVTRDERVASNGRALGYAVA